MSDISVHRETPDLAAVAVRMRGIRKRFGSVEACRDIDFEVRAGEIHGLLGENGAGKTTLMNILYGLLKGDHGSIEVDGVPVAIRNPKQAIEHGIGMVHQHFMLVHNMTVAENVALGLPSARRPLTELGKVANGITQLSDRHGLRVDPYSYINDLSVQMKQRVEILKLLYRDARFLILDEPTAVLTAPEWLELADILRSLVAGGRSVVFITHKLDELTGVADRCTVLRDGAVVDTVAVSETTKASLARMMVGRDVVLRVPRVPSTPGAPVLEVQGLTFTDPGGRHLDAISFEVRAGEVLGVAGIDGNGQDDLVEVLLGLRRGADGTVRFLGERVPDLAAPSVRRQVAVIPEDRHRFGCALELSLQDNLMLRDFRDPPFARRSVLRLNAIRDLCWRLVRTYDVRVPDIAVRMRQLSGGNQQKAVIGRELHRSPHLIIGVQPTRGLDVGAMEYVYQLLTAHKERGGATLLISADLDEVISLSDRVAVISAGRFLRTLTREEAAPETLGLLMAGEAV